MNLIKDACFDKLEKDKIAKLESLVKDYERELNDLATINEVKATK